MQHCYSSFWLAFAAGLICLSAHWRDRDEPEELHPAEQLEMGAWLRLKDAEQAMVVEAYAHRRPVHRKVSSDTSRQ